MKSNKEKKITFRLTEQEREAFEKICNSKGLTISKFLQHLVTKELNRNENITASQAA